MPGTGPPGRPAGRKPDGSRSQIACEAVVGWERGPSGTLDRIMVGGPSL
jgi:hypothetical protein